MSDQTETSPFEKGNNPLTQFNRFNENTKSNLDWYETLPSVSYERMNARRRKIKESLNEKSELTPVENPHYGIIAFQILREKLAGMNPSDSLTVEDASTLLELLIYLDTQLRYDAPEANYVHECLDRLNDYNKMHVESIKTLSVQIRYISKAIEEIKEKLAKIEAHHG